MLSVRTASGRLSYLLTRLQFQQFILFEWGPRVLELQIAFAETMSGLMDGTIPSTNAATIAIQNIAEIEAELVIFRRPKEGNI